MTQRKVGDTVRIRNQEWFDLNTDSEGYVYTEPFRCAFVPGMAQYLGKEAKIVEILPDGRYFLDIDDKGWYWCDYMFEDNLNVGDYVKVKSQEWLDKCKEKVPIVHESGIQLPTYRCDKIGRIVDVDTDGTVAVEFGEDDEKWFSVNWVDKVEDPIEIANSIAYKSHIASLDTVIKEGDLVFVSDRYHDDSPREDWTISKFVKARAKGIDTEEGIWTYCIPYDVFSYNNWQETKKFIFKGEDNVLKQVENE